MKAHTLSLVNAILLISMSSWGYLSSETPSPTSLIPLFFGVVIILCYNGVKKENKVIAHISVLLTLIVLVALFMPLKGALERNDSMATGRIVIMIIGSSLSMVSFVRSFIAARKNKQ